MNLSTGALWALSSVVTILLCVKAVPVTTMLRLLDIPGERKLHRKATPLMGGLALLCAFLPCAAALSFFATPSYLRPTIHVWLMAIVAMALLGLADDRHALSPRARLLVSFLIFGVVAVVDPKFNVRILFFEHPAYFLGLGTFPTAVFFSALCCVGLVNAINMADGKNGLAIGLCIGWLGILATRTPVPFVPFLGLLIFVLAVLFMFNLRGKLFLGDGGAYGFAAAIALLTIAIYNSPGPHATSALAAEEVVLLFCVPVFDSFRLTFKRLRRGQSPMAADKDHLHHILLNRFGWPRGLFYYWLMALGPACLAFSVI